jgi:hypothetical protein
MVIYPSTMTSLSTTTNTPLVADSLTVSGVGGQGFVSLPTQLSNPALTSGSVNLYSDAAEQLAWSTGPNRVTIDAAGLSADRTYSLPNVPGRITLDDNEATLMGKTLRGVDGNDVDANSLVGFAITGSPATGDILQFNTGTTQLQPLTLSAAAPLDYTSGVFTVDVGSTPGSVASGTDGRFSAVRHLHVKESAAGPGEFTSIYAAMATISASSSSSRWVIEVHPGSYVEDPMEVPTYVTLTTAGGVVITPSTPDTTLFATSGVVEISGFEFVGLGGATDLLLMVDSSENCRLVNCRVSGFSTAIRAIATGAVCSLDVEDCYFSPTIVVIDQDARAITGPFISTVNLRGCTFVGNLDSLTMVRSQGPLALMNIYGGSVVSPDVGTGLYMSDGTDVNLYGFSINGTDFAIHIDDAGDAPALQALSVNITNTGTYDVLVEHSGAVGSFTGHADYTKINQIAGSGVLLDMVDTANAGVVTTGKLLLGPAIAGDDITDYGVSLNEHMSLGVISGGVVTRAGSLDVSVTSGYGYARSPTDAALSKYISWGATVLTLSAVTTSYIYVDTTGAVSASISVGDATYIGLARVTTTGTDVEIIDDYVLRSSHPWSDYADFTADILGALYVSGSIVTANGLQELAVSGGTYYYAGRKKTHSGMGFSSTFSEYYHVGGVWTSSFVSTYDVNQYDDTGSGKTALPGGKYARHSLYVNGDGFDEAYFLVYGQIIYDTLLDAQNGVSPMPPASFSGDVVIIAGIIVLSGTAAAQDILDLRPMFRRASSQTAALLNHGDLAGLLNDDHTQYLRTDGVRAMTGNLKLGGNNIVSAGQVNGVVVQTHGSRHLPNGADPLTSAAPLTNLSATSMNTVGTANSFARSDHTHAVTFYKHSERYG